VDARESLRGTTALMWAAAQRHPEAVRALLAAGADYGATSGAAGLPRIYLAQAVNVENVELGQERRRAAEAGTEVAAAPGRSGVLTPEQEAAAQEAAAAEEAARAALNTAAARASTPDAAAAEPPAAESASDGADGPIAGLVGGGGGGLTALVFAARENDIETTRLLIDAGAEVNQQTTFGWSPLLTATNNRNYQLGKFLIENGADVNAANKGGMTPLYLATDNRNIEGGDYPVPRPDMDHLEFIRLLLANGADPNLRVASNTENRTIFTMQWFFEPGATAFVRAAQSGDGTLMRLLLEHGADPTIPTSFNDTALTAVAGIGWVEGVTFEWSREETSDVVRMLLDMGLDPNARNNDGRTPLMGAALKGRNEIIQLLVDRGARLEWRDYGSRDTEDLGSIVSGHTWQALDYSEGLVRVGVQSALAHAETAAFIRQLMIDQRLPVPPLDRTIESICVVEICGAVPVGQ
jgi:ankyrin repeat protein